MLRTQVPSPLVPVVESGTRLMERSWYRFFTNLYNYFADLPSGSFYDTTTQTATANTPTAITFNATTDSHRMRIGTPTSRVITEVAGTATITFSIQFTNATAAEDDTYVWLRKNGVDVPNSASVVTVPKKHGTHDGAIIMAINFHENCEAGDYIELVWLTVGGVAKIETVAASTSPARPASPGVILTISQII